MTKNKKVTRRLESTKKYMDAQIEKHSKLLVLRVDLSYKKPYSDEISLEDMSMHHRLMLNNARSKPSVYKNMTGYVCKKEYTKDKGPHMHMMVMYNGQKVQSATYIADQIGDHWNQITQGKGSYHNCHRNSYEDEGIGMLERSDTKKRKILYENVIPYLCKEEQSLEPMKKNKKDRAFVRGAISRKKKGE